MHTPTGCPPLDRLLGGGIEHGVLTLVYGEGGTGKSNLCLQLARNVTRGGRKVAYIDTEGASLERLGQLCEDPGPSDLQAVLRRILFFKPYSLKDQEHHVDQVERVAEPAGVGIILFDTVAWFFRLELGREDRRDESLASLRYQLNHLHTLARRVGLPILLTTQVYTDTATGSIEPVGGHLVLNGCQTILRLDKDREGGRSASIVKHRAAAEGTDAPFRITGEGLVAENGDRVAPPPLRPAPPPPAASPAPKGRRPRSKD